MKSAKNSKKIIISSKRGVSLIGIAAAALLAVFLLSFTLGRYGVPLGELVKILLGRIFPIAQTWTNEMETVVINIRLPRILLACMVGCCLSVSGAAYQGVFQNPMASPDILGASNGAAFGAATAILLGMPAYMITVFAFAASLITVAAVYLIGSRAPGLPTMNLILAGIMISSLFSAGTSYIKLVADPANQLPAITYWLMGSLSGTKMSDVALAALPMLLGVATLFCLRWQINLITLGDDEAKALGVNVSLIRFIIIICATLATAASVAISGMIGWVGLVMPHLSRKLVGSDYKLLMPMCMVLGAAFMLIVDDVSRNLLAVEIPIGILTAFVGAPFFIYLMTRRNKAL